MSRLSTVLTSLAMQPGYTLMRGVARFRSVHSVVATHHEPHQMKTGDRWNIRRYADEEIVAAYSPQRVHEICGEAGTGFAENTLCIHKGSTPRHEARRLLQVLFALLFCSALLDRRATQTLGRLV